MTDTNDDVTAYASRGANDPFRWYVTQESDGAVFSLAGNVAYLRVMVRGETVIDINSTDDAHLVVDGSAGTVTWTPTLAESRLVPKGSRALYELERWAGGVQRRICSGPMVGLGGENPDA